MVRARAAVSFPADFTLVAAANPCPCGFLGDERGCRCASHRLDQYRGRLSGPIRDRIDLAVAVPRQRYENLFAGTEEEASAVVRGRVEAARARQRQRAPQLNASIPGRQVVDLVGATDGARKLLAQSGEQFHLSARGFYRVLRVARTIADLAGDERVGEEAVAEALHYRDEPAA